MNEILTILAKYIAIKNTSKRYHWLVSGCNFYEYHLLFDKIADMISNDTVDKLIEIRFMGIGRKDIETLNNLTSLSVSLEGPVTSDSFVMIESLKKMCTDFMVCIEKINSIRGINAILDEMSSDVSQAYALLSSTSSKSNES